MDRRLAIVLGIRPDLIRASIILQRLRSQCDLKFIWSGQHYSENLKDVFFRQLGVPRPDIELTARGETDSEIVSSLIGQLHPVLEQLQPRAAVFLGDTNTVMGCIAAAQLNLPIVHIEGCMRSYDWRMPEEKYRTVVDHLSDVIYAYLDEHKQQGVAEGLNPQGIVVTGNPIVDVLDKYYYHNKNYYATIADKHFFSIRHITKGEYYLMTCHRRENVHDLESLHNILELVAATGRTVYFVASYRTQREIKAHSIEVPSNVIVTDPVGYEEFLVLMTNSHGVLSDSGTVIEEACILQVPAVQMRRSTERPQVYDVGACVKFDPTKSEGKDYNAVFSRLESLHARSWRNPFGDGKSSERIANDILRRLEEDRLSCHEPADYHLDIKHQFRDDDLDGLLES
jgi:UDP-N-acetylglucosamine 2-epimerase (non-hydrolysing)